MQMLQCNFDRHARHFTWETQKYLEGTGPYIGTCLQLYQKQYNWFHLPIDLIFGTNTTNLKGNNITYVENLKKRMEWAYKTANDVIKKEQERNK